MFYKPIAALAILCLLWAGLSCAQQSQPRKHVFYLHGMIVQVQGINANPNIPVHPGLAKFLKEHKAWDDKWKVGGKSS